MTARIVKLESSLAPPFSAQKTHVKYNVSASLGTIDTARSYLLFNTQINTTGPGVHKVFLGKGLDLYDGTALIRHARLTSKTNGILEEIVQPNILTYNLDAIALPPFQQKGDLFGKGITEDGHTAFRNLGLTSSSDRDVELRIPLRRLYGICSADDLPLSKVGDLVMDLELEDRIPVVAENRLYVAGTTLALQDDAGGAAITVVKSTSTAFTTDQSLTLWADAAVTVDYTDSAGAPQSVVTTITDVSRNASDEMVLTLANDLGSAAITAVSLVQNEATTIAYNILDAQLVVYQRPGSGDTSDLLYSTWQCERVNKAPTTVFERNFDLVPQTANVIMMTPLVNELVSSLDNCEAYRMRLNGEDTTDEDIKPNDSALYRDRLTMSFENASIPVMALAPNNTLYANPIPLRREQQVLHMSMVHSTPSASPTTYLYRQVEREV